MYFVYENVPGVTIYANRTILELLILLTIICFKVVLVLSVHLHSLSSVTWSFFATIFFLMFSSFVKHLRYYFSHWDSYILLHFIHFALFFYKMQSRACSVFVTWLSLWTLFYILFLWPGPFQKPACLLWASCCYKTHWIGYVSCC